MVPRVALVALAFIVLGSVVRPVSAIDQFVLGKVFLVANPDAGDPAKRRLKVIGREPSGSATIVGDPTLFGAWLYVEANDPTPPPEGERFFFLPASGWSPTATGFTFRDPGLAITTAKVASIRDNGRVFQIKAVIGPKAPLPISILPPAPGADAGATLAINGGDTYCMRFGGAAGGRIRNAPADSGERLFKVTNPTAEAGCAHCGDQGGGVCGGSCGFNEACTSVFGGGCACIAMGTFTTTSTSSTSTSSTTLSSPSAAFVDG